MEHITFNEIMEMMDNPAHQRAACDCYFFVGDVRVEVEHDDDEAAYGWWFATYTEGNYDTDAKLDADGPFDSWVEAVDEGIYQARRYDGARLIA